MTARISGLIPVIGRSSHTHWLDLACIAARAGGDPELRHDSGSGNNETDSLSPFIPSAFSWKNHENPTETVQAGSAQLRLR